MSAAPILATTIKITMTNILSGESFQFEKPVITIGRGPENDVVVSNDAKMSREHAQIRQQSGQVFIKNLSKKNFILVNGLPVEDYLIDPGAQIQIGESVFHLNFDKPANPANLSLVPSSKILPSAEASSRDVATSMSSASNRMPEQNVSFNKQPIKQPISMPDKTVGHRNLSATKSNFNTNPMSSPNFGNVPPAMSIHQKQEPNWMIIGLVLIGLLGAYFFFTEKTRKANNASNITMEQDRIKAIDDTTKMITKLEEEKSKKGENTVQYKAAQEHYVKGLRDYYNGQYSRAMVAFQSAMSIYPDHSLSRRYWTIAKAKFDEQVDIHMRLGKRYLGQNNYRLCMSEFRTVLTMVKDQSDLKYKESKSYYDQCRVSMETGN